MSPPAASHRARLHYAWMVVAITFLTLIAAGVRSIPGGVMGAYDHAFLISGSLCVLTAVTVLAIGQRATVANSSPLRSGATATPESDWTPGIES